MSYLPDFQYDVFLSYSHKDNDTPNEREDGLITKFYKQLNFYLSIYLEGTNTPSIWCDHELRKNVAFDDRIKNVIGRSAVFLAITSNRFFTSAYCCEKELN